MSSACQRAVLTCARCRKRKIKCDRQLPSCTPCLKARATCLGLSPNSDEIPRSLLLSLENEIAQLEAELAESRRLNTLSAGEIEILSQMPLTEANSIADDATERGMEISRELPLKLSDEDALSATVLSSNFMQAFVSTLMPSGSSSSDLLLKVRLGMTPSSSSIGSPEKSSPATTTRKADGGLDMKVLASMPSEIVRTLLHEYITVITPQHPFLSEATICQHFEHVAAVLGWNQDPQVPRPEILNVEPSYSFLIIYLVLAIAVTLEIPKGAPEGRCVALSTSLFAEGIEHFTSLNACPSDITWLQTMLLMILYATIFPRSANVWVLSGAAMRACVELGLHREVPAGYEIDANSREVRRIVFWATYCMDRSICSAQQLPFLSTPDIAINTRLPQKHVEAAFLSSIEYHQLLSEMGQVHFQGEALPGGATTWEEWLLSMDTRLRRWREKHPEIIRKVECPDFLLARGLLMLHRPSPRIPMPSESSLLLAFEAASTSAQANQIHIESGALRRPWLSAHHTLEAAMVVIFCLRHGYQIIRTHYKPSQIFQMTKHFTANFLIIASQGWPEVSNYAGVYERLLSSLLEPLFSSSTTTTTAAANSPEFTPAQDAELTQLLYPSPAQLEKLRLGHQPQQLGNFGVGAQEIPELWDMDYNFLDWDLLGAAGHENGTNGGGGTEGAGGVYGMLPGWETPDITFQQGAGADFNGVGVGFL